MLILNGKIVTGDENKPAFIGHVLINMYGKIYGAFKGGKDEADDLISQYPKAQIIDAQNKIVMPGGIDPHVHLENLQGPYMLETADNIFTGSVAAVCGGTTSYIDFVEPNLEEQETAKFAIYEKIELGEETSVIDFAFHLTLNYINNFTATDVNKILYGIGINSYKFHTFHGRPSLNETGTRYVLELLKKYGGLAMFHCEDEKIIKDKERDCEDKERYKPKYLPLCHPPESERASIEKVLKLNDLIGFPQGIHIAHVSSETSIPLIKEAKDEGIHITAEVTPHHLILTNEVYDQKNGVNFITYPPLREKSDTEALWNAVRDGVIDFVVSDHSPFTSEQRRGERTKPDYRISYDKKGKINKIFDNASEQWWTDGKPPFYKVPEGVAGIETRIILMYHYGVVEKRISLEKFVDLVSSNAAKRFGLYPDKGHIGLGADADITIIDPNGKTEITADSLHQNCDTTPFEGMILNGKIDTVITRGIKMVENGKLLPEGLNNRGHYITRQHYFLEKVKDKD